MVARAAIRCVLAGVLAHWHREGKAYKIRRVLHLLEFPLAGRETAFETRFHVHDVAHGDAAQAGIGVGGAFFREELEQRLVHADETLAHRDARQNGGDALGYRGKIVLGSGIIRIEIGMQDEISMPDHQQAVHSQILADHMVDDGAQRRGIHALRFRPGGSPIARRPIIRGSGRTDARKHKENPD